MGQFSLKRLFASMALIAIGLATACLHRRDSPEVLTLWLATILIGAGVGTLFKRPILGLVIGALVIPAHVLVLAILFPVRE
jgi:hypothetical protein